MKTLIFLLPLMCAVLIIQAQDYQISFSGSGQSNTVDSVQVLNLTQGTTLSLNGNDILHLVETSGVNTISVSENKIKVYPNPTMEAAYVEFEISNRENVSIEVIDEMGALITKQSSLLRKGTQRFEIMGLNTGIYTINVSTSEWKYGTKIISLGKNIGNVTINHLGSGDGDGESYDRAINNTKDLVPMQYNDGEMLLFKGFADNYARVLTFVPTQSQTIDLEFIPCVDEDGNNYAVVTIGTQTWMAENLKYLPSVSTSSDNSYVDPYYYVYDYEGTSVSEAKATDNYKTYGVLYNWPAALNACPSGWHLPTDNEWKTLEMHLGMSQSEANQTGWHRGTDEGKKLKSTSGWYDNGIGTDEVGFSAFPGGYRGYYGGFYDLGEDGYWWSATADGSTFGWFRHLYYKFDEVHRFSFNKPYGYSVRCVRD